MTKFCTIPTMASSLRNHALSGLSDVIWMVQIVASIVCISHAFDGNILVT